MHIAGTPENKRVANAIMQEWSEAGLQGVHFDEYEVLLSYPRWNDPNYLQVLNSASGVVYTTAGRSPVVIPSEQSPLAGHRWLAYSGNGSVVGDVVYCNYGSENDFDQVRAQGIDVKGKLVLVRYGRTFRASKAKTAEIRGVVGVIIYSDPEESAPKGTNTSDTYPNTVYMPATAVQRGTMLAVTGDPQTPLYPSKPNLWRAKSIEQAKKEFAIPSIPIIPITYTTAQEIFKRMNGNEVDTTFKGTLNVKYRYGPGLNNGEKLKIIVNGLNQISKIQKVLGYIVGREDPDRYVIIGNHYDAWTYGSMDPNSGTAVLAEVARAMMQYSKETNWKPVRTILFANFDAEEFGLVGSTEFVEQFQNQLSQRAVAYINLDLIMGNKTLMVQANPNMAPLVFDAAKSVDNPRQDEIRSNRKTAYDSWLFFTPDASKNKTVPMVSTPAGGSDNFPFFNYLGVPVIVMSYINPEFHASYPLYHTMYETPFLNEHLMDTDGFKVHKAVGDYMVELLIRLAEESILPIKISYLAKEIAKSYVPSFLVQLKKTDSNKKQFVAAGLDQTEKMQSTANKLLEMAEKFDNNLPDDDFVGRRSHNDRFLLFERCFVNPRGLASPVSRHVLFSASAENHYGSSVMPQLYAALYAIVKENDSTKLAQLASGLAESVSVVHYSLQCAISSLQTFL